MILCSRFTLFLIFSFMPLLLVSQHENDKLIKKVDHSDQSWYIEMQMETPNFNHVQKEYNSYFKEHPFERSMQKSQVRRWLMTSDPVVSEDGLVRKYAPTKQDYDKIATASKKAAKKYQSYPTLEPRYRSSSPPPNGTWNDSVGTWRMIGPYHNRTHNMFGGFNDRVFINRFNTDNMIAGQSYGGLWTSQDGGDTWKLTDAEYPNGKNTYANRDMYYGEIEVHPTDANRIIVGSDAGVLISNDAGESWDLVDELNYIDKPTERSYFIAQKNDDTDVILSSYGTKIYRTSDGGTTWSVVFDNSAVTHRRSTYQHSTTGVYHRWYNFAGLEFDHNNPNVVYLAAINSNNETCLHKSTDAGLTFTQILNTGSTKWLKMVYSPSEPKYINFANIFVNLQSPNSDEGIYKYNDSGSLVSFKAYPANPNARASDDIMQSQTDANYWATSGYSSNRIFYTNDGGTTYSMSSNTVHADVRAFAMVGDTVLVGTDGGLHISYDGGATLKEASQWISAIDLWGFSSAYKGELVAAGDDHGPTEFRITDADRSWHRTGGADSEHVQINKCDQNYAYGRDVYSPFLGEKINDSTFIRRGNYIPEGNFKYLAQDPDECYKFYPTSGNELKLSENNMVTQAVTKTFANSITKVEVVLKNNNIRYVLENRRIVHKTSNDGATWQVITPPSAVTNGRTQIVDIETDESGNQVWLAYGENQTSCKVVQSDDGGATWTNVTGNNLPAFAVSHVTYQRGTDGVVYIGLQPGSVWYKSNADSDWSMLGSGLPMIGYITTMYTIPDMGKLRMGSSRGAWEHDLPVASDVVSHFSVSSRESNACHLDTIKFFDYSSYFGDVSTTFSWTFEGGNPATSTEMNPKVVYTQPGIYDVTLTVNDINGQSDTYTREDFMYIEQAETCGPDKYPSYAYQNTSAYHYMTAPGMNVEETQNYTMMAWIKGEGAQTEYAGILSHTTSNGSVHLNVRSVGQDSTELGYHHPNGQWWWSSGFYLKPGEWTHVALVVEPTGISLYKNGHGKKHNRTVQIADLTSEFRVGGMIGRNDRCLKGMMDEVVFYNRSLTEDEIRTMMHLTKEHPDYMDQHDADILAYYQFNKSTTTSIDDVTGNGKNGNVSSQVTMVESDGPFGGGRSQLINITSNTHHDFADPGVQLEFQTSNPNGDVVTSHIENVPDVLPAEQMHEEGYYIVNNYGQNQIFAPLLTMKFTKSGTISNAVQTSGLDFKIWNRVTNMHDLNFSEIITNNLSTVAGINGSIIANDASPITSLGQFFITRDDYPLGSPQIRMVPPAMANALVEGGESISLYVDSDNQGMKLPVLSNAEIDNLGIPSDGTMVYAEDLSSIITFSNGIWSKLTAAPLLSVENGTVEGTEMLTIGSVTPTQPSAIVEMANIGLLRFTNLDELAILDLKYPSEGSILYNTTISKLVFFNGTSWQEFQLDLSNLPTSSIAAADVDGITLNGVSNQDNVLLDDKSIDATIQIPTLSASMIKDPIEGLFIYDVDRRSFMFFDGSLWNEVSK